MAEINMEQVTGQTVQQLGAENAMLRLELNAQIATVQLLTNELEAAKADAPEPKTPTPEKKTPAR